MISEIKDQVHQISREIAIWMFEWNPDGASITKEEYENICSIVMKESGKTRQNFLIGSFFKIGIFEGNEEISFVHRSIYEYFVAETISYSIETGFKNNSQDKLAGEIAEYLKIGQITYTIGEYLKNKLLKLYNNLKNEKRDIYESFYCWLEEVFGKMVVNGMFYYTGRSYKNIIVKECNCFLNFIEILRLLLDINKREYILSDVNRKQLGRYIRHCCVEIGMKESGGEFLDLQNVSLERVDLHGLRLTSANLSNTDLSNANLKGANLSNAVLKGANLSNADLQGTEFKYANLVETHLRGANMIKANLEGANLDNADLRGTQLKSANMIRVSLKGTNLSHADLRGTTLIETNLGEANLEASIWYNPDIQKVRQQLLTAHFTYLMVSQDKEMKEVKKSDISSNII